MTAFEETKARLLEKIELGGFSDPRTLRDRQYLDMLIAAQVALEEPDSIRALMYREKRRKEEPLGKFEPTGEDPKS